MATFRQRKSGYWQAIVRRKGYPDGSKTFPTKADAERWARDVESKMDKGIFMSTTEAESTTLHEALERYEREVSALKKGRGPESVRLRRWKADPLASRMLASIRGSDLAAYRDRRLNEGMSNNSVRLELSLIGHVFTIAAKEWGMEGLANPAARIRKPSPAKARDRRLMPGEEGRLMESLAACKSSYMRPLAALALETAMRQGELLRLRWADVDLKRRTAALSDTKNGDARVVPLSTTAVAILEALPTSIDGQVFPISQSLVVQAWGHAMKRAGIEDLRFHDLRHEATSRLFEKGFNPMEAASVTGHKTLQMLKRYTHLRAEDLAQKLG
ncbi:MAG: site-specific integrase [Betaproteobacteria bacterium]|nr:site-specific integrase [Betaproteobacteria bacterium]